VGRGTEPTLKRVVIICQLGMGYQMRNGIPNLPHNLKLDWLLGVLFYDHGSFGCRIAMENISNPELSQIIAPQFAINCQIEERQIANMLGDL